MIIEHTSIVHRFRLPQGRSGKQGDGGRHHALGRPARTRAEAPQSPRARGGAGRLRWMGRPDAGGYGHPLRGRVKRLALARPRVNCCGLVSPVFREGRKTRPRSTMHSSSGSDMGRSATGPYRAKGETFPKQFTRPARELDERSGPQGMSVSRRPANGPRGSLPARPVSRARRAGGRGRRSAGDSHYAKMRIAAWPRRADFLPFSPAPVSATIPPAAPPAFRHRETLFTID